MTATLGPVGSPRAMRFEPDMSPPDDDESFTSLQPLGAAQVLVEWVAGDDGAAEVIGAWISGELIEADEFARSTVKRWSLAIEREIERDYADEGMD